MNLAAIGKFVGMSAGGAIIAYGTIRAIQYAGAYFSNNNSSKKEPAPKAPETPPPASEAAPASDQATAS